jgi:endonuclease III
MGNSRGATLMTDASLHDCITYQAIARLTPKQRRAILRKTLAAAPVRMAERKADWLCKNFRRIQRDGGPDKVKTMLCACSGRDEKITFLRTFHGIGPKYARNILMDAYHREFRDSIAFDDRLKKVANALGLKFSRYEDAERFFLDVAGAAGLSGWELDRLLYNAIEKILPEIVRHSSNNLRVVARPSPRRRRGCKA